MFSEVVNFLGLEQELDHLGFFATEAQTHLNREDTGNFLGRCTRYEMVGRSKVAGSNQ
ncbi:hypothetical protein H1P_2280006 [Hyella patelloides LEGE 07179]|uniref:Uncharacterized protein n=1 Tax=Hyella patelloides LEGE 07179 TaxID=945734 RepID=A0A563VRA5_9CYAN|nr:hypothetical protein [Hyella patelloides]VEP13920.1 hypothetical protein H1P_2280006 [Hyella patelloides LEGE 07179]